MYIFLEDFKQYFLYNGFEISRLPCEYISKVSACFCGMETLTNSNDCSESDIIISVPASSVFIGGFLQCTVHMS
jgi:hypothetical protein